MKVGVGLQQHIALVDAGPSPNRGAVDAEAVFKGGFRQLRDGIGNVMPQSWNIGEAQIKNLRVVLLGERQNGLGISHENSLPESDCSLKSGERLRRSGNKSPLVPQRTRQRWHTRQAATIG